MKFENIIVEVPNYTTISLDIELKRCGEQGFKLVNVVMAKNKYGIEVMYLCFFVREVE